jgi:uncharacterized protein (UPF0333 family)
MKKILFTLLIVAAGINVAVAQCNLSQENPFPSQTVCYNESTNIALAVATSDGEYHNYTWEESTSEFGPWSNAQGSSNEQNYTTPSLASNRYYRRRVETGCLAGSEESTSAAVLITVNTPPTAPTGIGGVTSICNGGSTILTAIGGNEGYDANYEWSTGSSCGNTIIEGENGVSITVKPTGTTVYWVRRIDVSSCNTQPTECARTEVIVNDIPTLNSIENITLCAGDFQSTISLGGTNITIANCTWTNNNTDIGLTSGNSGHIKSFDAKNDTNSPITAIITVTPNSSEGCSGEQKSFAITVNPSPVLDALEDQTLCAGAAQSAINFSGINVSAANCTWTNGNTDIGLTSGNNGNITSFDVKNNTDSLITAKITVTPKSSESCSGEQKSFAITVNPSPVLDAIEDQTLCAGETLNDIIFKGTNVEATKSTWINTTSAIGLATSGTGNIGQFEVTNSTHLPITATIIVTPKSLKDCSGASKEFTITIEPTNIIILTSATVTENQTKCVDAAITNITYSTIGATDATVEGFPESLGIEGNWVPTGSNTGEITISGQPTMTTDTPLTYTITLTGGCGEIIKTGTIMITPGMNVNILGESSQEVKIYTSIEDISYSSTDAIGAICDNLPAGITCNWSSGKITISGTPREIGIFEYSITLISTCGTVDTTGTITVSPDNIPNLSFIQAPNPVCTNQKELTYKVTSLDDATYTWEIENGTINSRTDSVVVVHWNNVASTGTLTVEVTADEGRQSSTVSQTVAILQAPAVAPDVNDIVHKTDNSGTPYMLIYPNSAANAGNYAYQWYKNDQPVEDATKQFFYLKKHNQTLEPGTEYKVHVSDMRNATCGNFSKAYTLSQNSKSLQAKPFTVSPNPVSNGYFTISLNEDLLHDAENCTLSIYSLLGEKVWEQPIHSVEDIIIPKTMTAGVYTITVLSETGQYNEKILVK